MSDSNIGRLTLPTAISIAAGVKTSSALRVEGWAGGKIFLPSNYVGGTGFWASAPRATATYVLDYDSAGVSVGFPAAASRAIQIPDSVMVGSYAKLVGTNKQTSTAGAAAISVTLKG